ncbi:MAG: family ATPase, partial [Solirubrobacterales bacterium]|nr:family ATPase [Solirubrobacterales bacterium]
MAGALPPLLGRAAELAAVSTALAEGGCLIAGPAGVGKSRLAGEAAHSAAASEHSVLRVVATASAASVPFGAISHLLPDGAPAAPRIPDFIASLRSAGVPRTLLVDDAHLLDGASAALVMAVAASRAARVLVTVRSTEPAPDAVTSLWKDRIIDRVDLQPLARSEVHEMVEAMLRGSVHGLVHDWLFEVSQGNPLYVSALVADSLGNGRLVQRDERWHLTGDRVAFGRVSDLIAGRVTAVSDAARDALDFLAVGSPLPLAHLEQLVAPEAVEELERAHLAVMTFYRGAADVELAHPLYGEVTAANMAQSTARRVRRRLADVLARSDRLTEGEQLRVATWLLEAGSIDEARFLAASAVALRHGAPDLANRLAEAAGETLEAAVSLAQARSGLARFDDVEPILAAREADGAAAPAALAAAYVQARGRALLHSTREPGDAAALIDRAASWHDDRDWRALIAAQRAWGAIYDERPARAHGHVLPYVEDATLRPDRRFQVLTVAMYAASRLARIDECESIDREITQHLRGYPDAPWEASAGRLLLEGAHITAGRDLAGVAVRLTAARDAAAQGGDRPIGCIASHLLCDLAIARGDAAAAVGHGQDAYDALELGDPLNVRGAVLLSLSKAHALLGDATHAAEAVDEAERLVASRPGLARRARLEIGHARALVELAAGRSSAARELLLGLADRSGEDVVHESLALHDAIRIGANPRACAERLVVLAAVAQDPAVGMYAEHAIALAAADGLGLLEQAQRFEALGYDLIAAEAAASAAE